VAEVPDAVGAVQLLRLVGQPGGLVVLARLVLFAGLLHDAARLFLVVLDAGPGQVLLLLVGGIVKQAIAAVVAPGGRDNVGHLVELAVGEELSCAAQHRLGFLGVARRGWLIGRRRLRLGRADLPDLSRRGRTFPPARQAAGLLD